MMMSLARNFRSTAIFLLLGYEKTNVSRRRKNKAFYFNSVSASKVNCIGAQKRRKKKGENSLWRKL